MRHRRQARAKEAAKIKNRTPPAKPDRPSAFPRVLMPGMMPTRGLVYPPTVSGALCFGLCPVLGKIFA
jgi:hypothetical protein